MGYVVDVGNHLYINKFIFDMLSVNQSYFDDKIYRICCLVSVLFTFKLVSTAEKLISVSSYYGDKKLCNISSSS